MRCSPSLSVAAPKLMSRPTEIGQAEVGEHLFAVHRCQSLDRLQFHDHPAVDEQVGAEPLLKDHAIVGETDDLLSLHREAASFKRPGEHRFIDRFEQARAEVPVDRERGVDDGAGDVVEVLHGLVL